MRSKQHKDPICAGNTGKVTWCYVILLLEVQTSSDLSLLRCDPEAHSLRYLLCSTSLGSWLLWL